MRKKKRQQRIVANVGEVPAEFVALKSFGNARPDANPPRLSTWQYNLIQTAWESERITGVKVMRSLKDKAGPVYVSKEEADELLQDAGPRARQVRIEKTTAPNLAGVVRLVVELRELSEQSNQKMDELNGLLCSLQTKETETETTTDAFQLFN